ncbi:MAG TPA: DUF2752 domain-containing protein [Pilimelia sp.]|nr:DUF2752 domain-containing protein [Pilimelia sp.]
MSDPGPRSPAPAAPYPVAPAPAAPYPVAPAPAGYPPAGGAAPAWAYPASPRAVPGRVERWLTGWVDRAPWAAPLAVLGCVAAAAGYVLVTDPTDGRADAPPTCLLKFTTGLDCPGCGGTRALFFLLHGQLGAAARHHLLFVLLAPLLLYAYAAWAWASLTGRRLPTPRLTGLAWAALAGVALLFTVARNLPWAPFAWLYV